MVTFHIIENFNHELTDVWKVFKIVKDTSGSQCFTELILSWASLSNALLQWNTSPSVFNYYLNNDEEMFQQK